VQTLTRRKRTKLERVGWKVVGREEKGFRLITWTPPLSAAINSPFHLNLTFFFSYFIANVPAGMLLLLLSSFLIFWPSRKKMMQFLNWNFEFFFFLVFRVDWVNYYICRETGGRVIDDWAKVSCPSIGSWPAKQAGKIFFYFLSFFYLKILFVEKRTRESGCLIFLIFGWRVYYCGALFTIRDVLGEEGGKPASSGSSVCPSPDLTCDAS
jgi:hypothetical protein